MPLPYSLVCDLLEECATLCAQRKPYQSVVKTWFGRHRALINAHDTDIAALLSTLLPEMRTDRVYSIRAPTLQRIIGRALCLGTSRIKDLAVYQQPGSNADLADCVERILRSTPNSLPASGSGISVEDIDTLLHSLAARTIWSSPSVRSSQPTASFHNPRCRSDLDTIYKRLSAIEAKWFTRLLLKNYQPLIFRSGDVFRLCDDSLPAAMQIIQDFTIATKAVQLAKSKLLPNSSRSSTQKQEILKTIKPQIGVKVGRQPWLKGRSIKHCLDMGHGRMSIEEKIDGEYCQIHFDRSNKQTPLQIFSKSGKDSTQDRKKVHGAILDSLRQGHADFKVDRCILEGELVVYSDRERKIRPFHIIRNYVTRRGMYLHTDQDSGPKEYEHLMMVYFDILSVNDDSLLHVRHTERRKELQSVITCMPGRAELVSSLPVDFDRPRAASDLRNRFAQTIVRKGEGLVIKPDEPYFDFAPTRKYASSCIKLKKEYIGNFGDIGDIAVVGAGYDAAVAKTYGLPALKWTHFYLGCLDNKEEVIRWQSKPEFKVVNIVQLNETQLKSLILNGNTESVRADDNHSTILKMAGGLLQRPPLQVCFIEPPVFDLRCFGFDKEGNNGFWTPRFPGISKIHFDRDFLDTMTFDELQERAQEAARTPDLEDSQENLEWIRKLECADPRGMAIDAASQLTISSLATPSPRKRTQSFSTNGSPHSPIMTRSQPNPVSPQYGDVPKLDRSALLSSKLMLPHLSVQRDALIHLSPEKQKPMGRLEDSPSVVPSTKRSKTRYDATTKGGLAAKNDSQTRQPLADVTGNLSQRAERPAATTAPKEKEVEVAEPVFFDLTNSPPSSPSGQSTASDASSLLDTDEFGKHDTAIITLPSSSEANAGTPPSQSAANNQNAVCTASLGTTTGCVYSVRACHFARKTVLIAVHLEKNADLLAHLQSHAIELIVADPAAGQRAPWTKKLQSASEAILLVDSIGYGSDVRVLVGGLKDILNATLDEIGKRAWITVYDYRVLDDIKVLEDASIGKKYYKGFSDPWRRWRVGLI